MKDNGRKKSEEMLFIFLKIGQNKQYLRFNCVWSTSITEITHLTFKKKDEHTVQYEAEFMLGFVRFCVFCSWTDGSALDYENWENGRFSRKPGQNCIQMSSQSGKQYMYTIF